VLEKETTLLEEVKEPQVMGSKYKEIAAGDKEG